MEDEIGGKTTSYEPTDNEQAEEKSEHNSVQNIKIGYIGGGSRGWAYVLINDLAQCADISGEVALYDIDKESAKRNERFGNWVQKQEGAEGDWTYTAVEDRADALKDADFVILSTQDPPDETMAYEIDIPADYGIYQSVGDTVGPGGVIRAMRTIPTYRDIAAGIREHCPNAWVINYTNPMTICVRTLYKEFPEIKAFGACHEVFHTQEHLAELVGKYMNVEQPPRAEIKVNVKGINHFTWIDEATWKDSDLFPLINRHLEKAIRERSFDIGDLDDESYFVDNELVAYELFERFGIFPAAGDRHIAEFVPWFLPVDEPSAVQSWGIRLTPSEYRTNRQKEALAKFHDPMDKDEGFEFFESDEEGIKMIRALLGFEELKTNVNVPNQGQILNLPDDAVVETNALFTQDDVTPVIAGEIPDQVHNIISTHVQNQETLIKAGFNGDIELAFRAFLNDPMMSLPMDNAKDLFKEMIDAVYPYLNDHWNLETAAVVNN